MNNFSKKLGVLTLGISLVVGVGAVLAMPKSNSSIKADAATPATGTTYKLVNSTDDLVAGENYAFVGINGTNYYAAATDEDNYVRKAVSITVNNNSFSSTAKVLNLQLGVQSGAWTFVTTNYNKTSQGYLASANSSLERNYLRVVTYSPGSTSLATCTINFDGDAANIVIEPDKKNNVIKFNPSLNSGAGGFACYQSTQQSPIYLYKALSTAKDWANNFMTKTATACADPSLDNREAVEKVWSETETYYNGLDEANKTLIQSAQYEDENLGEAVKRYDTIIKKYASSSSIISNYIDRTITSNNKSLIGSDTTTAIIIASAVALISVSVIGGYFFIKKTKHE